MMWSGEQGRPSERAKEGMDAEGGDEEVGMHGQWGVGKGRGCDMSGGLGRKRKGGVRESETGEMHLRSMRSTAAHLITQPANQR